MSDRRALPGARSPYPGPPTMATQVRSSGGVGPSSYGAPNTATQSWTALRTADGKHLYYHNRSTNETTWTRPADYVDPGPAPGLMMHTNSTQAMHTQASVAQTTTPTQIPVFGTPWFEVAQPGKPSYFHRPDTKQVTWTPPAQVVNARRTGLGGNRIRGVGSGAPPCVSKAEEPPTRTNAVPTAVTKSNVEANAAVASKIIETIASAPDEKKEEASDDDDVEFDPSAYEEYEDEVNLQQDGDGFPEAGGALQNGGGAFRGGSAGRHSEETVIIGGYVVPTFALAPEELVLIRAEQKKELIVMREGRRKAEEAEKGEKEETTEKEEKVEESPAEKANRFFRELLVEKNVDGKSRWDRTVREIQGDTRFKALGSHAERRRQFERFVRDAGDVKEKTEKEKPEQKKNVSSVAEAERARERSRKEHRVRREREDADARVSFLRKQNFASKNIDNFKVLLAELIRDPLAKWEDSSKKLFGDSQKRALASPDFPEPQMRSLFETHVQAMLHQRVVDVADLLDEKLVASSAKDFEDAEEMEGSQNSDDDDDVHVSSNPFTSFVAVSGCARITTDPRWDRCPLEHRASAYCGHVEKMCVSFSVEVRISQSPHSASLIARTRLTLSFYL